MSLKVYLSNTGQRLLANVDSITSIDSLKEWIATNSQIAADRQILMTGKGKNVKQQHLLSEGEIFVYDKTSLATGTATIETSEKVSIPEIRDFPSTLEDEQSLAAWQELFAARRAWALDVSDIVRAGVESVDRKADESEVLERCMQVALENLQNHFLSLQQAATRTQTWAKEIISEHREVLSDWRDSAKVLSELPVREEVAALLHNVTTHHAERGQGTMSSLFDSSHLESASTKLADASAIFQRRVSDLETNMTNLKSETAKAMTLSPVDWPSLNTEGLVQEIETMAAKASRDYEDTLRATDDQKSIAQISRQAARHTSELLPAIAEMGGEITRMIEDANSHRATMAEICQTSLKEISKIQSQFAGTHNRISELKVTDDGVDSLRTLDKVFRLPIAYGSTMVEAIRRSEWHERMRADLDSLREEIAQLRDEEGRRRKKWVSSLADFVNNDSHNVTEDLLNLNFSASTNAWPVVSREEIFAYIDDLRALQIDDAVQQVTQLLKQLDTASKSKRPVKNALHLGSVSGLGRSIQKDGEEVKGLPDDRARLEEKLRASESRIRKLEDLLHRQSQSIRPASGLFTPHVEMERQTSSPGPSSIRPVDMQSRRSSVSLRRLSNQSLDEKVMVQRIVALEAQITKLQEEAHAERRSSTESRDKMQEAEAVKRDLMANFESQRQEFDEERQLLEDENHKLKIRLEEAEDELEQVLGSRDHHRMTQEQVIANLRADTDRMRRVMGEEIDQSKRSKERLQADYISSRDRATSLERQLQQSKDEKSALLSQQMTMANEMRAAEAKHQERLISLQAVHSFLSPSSSVPEDFDRLIGAVEILAEGAAIHARGLDDNLRLATAENKAQLERASRLEGQIETSGKELDASKKRATEAFEEISELRNKLSIVRHELQNEREELQTFRDKFAAGETGSDTLKVRLSEKESRIAEMLEKEGEKDAQTDGLRHEVTELKTKIHELEVSQENLRAHFEERSGKAKDLSKRLFQHHDRVIRMLENFGYVITRQEDTLTLQRASKVSASTTLSADGSSPMKRTISNSVAIQHYTEPSDLETLYWTTDDSSELENTKYTAFINAVTRLDLDSSLEVMTKRYKDMEAAAKKYQKDSRANRDRCNRLQSEAHDKIAYRSFKEGDLALFLPTRNQATKPWAAFNVGAPHRFLREQDAHNLQTRDWLLARITKVEERVVDLSRSLSSTHERSSMQVEGSDGGSTRSVEDENPFELSDGLRWYYIDATEEKPGAPATPGLGKSTAAASVVDVKGHMSRRSLTGKNAIEGGAVNAAKTLSKSLDSRRSSEASRKSGNIAALRAQGSSTSGIHAAATAATATTAGPGTDGLAEGRMSTATPSVRPSDEDVRTTSPGTAREDAQVFDVEVDTEDHATQQQPGMQAQHLVNKQPQVTVRRLQEGRSQKSSPTKRPWERLFSLEYSG